MHDKRVLLIDPTFNPGNIPPNLGLGHIEAKLMANHITCIVADFVLPLLNYSNLSLDNFWALEQKFIEESADLAATVNAVYISGSHGMEMKPYAMFPRIRALAIAVKKVNPKAKVIFGGALANYYTVVMKFQLEQFRSYGIDEFVTGQEVNATQKILESLEIKPTLRLAASSNTLNDAILPSWQAWNLSKYPDYLSAMITLGCPFTCSFCFEGKIYEPHNKQILANDIPNWIELIQPRRNIQSVMIEDSIAISLPWFSDLLKVMGQANLSWAIYARSNEIVKYGDRVAALRDAGCHSVIIGIESFEDDLHISTNKKITTNQSLKALDSCAKAGVSVQGCMILGFPDDTLEKIERRITLAQSYQLSTYRWHFLQPDWTNIPTTIRGLEQAKPEDILNVQVSMPDSCIPEYLETASPMAIYDEHLLIRALPYYHDIPRLANFGYVGMPDFRNMMDLIQPLITQTGLPTNEDEMYPLLFEPTQRPTNKSLQPESLGTDTKIRVV